MAMEKINIEFYCEKCKKRIKTFYFSDIPVGDRTKEHRVEVINYLKFLHNKRKHTVCQICGKKIKPNEGHDYLPYGWESTKVPKSPGEWGTFLFLLVCEKCNEKYSKYFKKGGE